MRRQRRGNKEEATKKKWQERIRVSVVLEPEAGRRPEICLPDAKSVGEPAVAFWPLAVRILKNYTASYSDQISHYPSPLSSMSLIIQVSYHPSPLLTKSHPSTLHQSRFFLPCLWFRLEGFFINNIYDLSVFLLHFLIEFKEFFINWSLIRFSFSVFPLLGWEVFHQWHDPLRLISFPTGLGCSEWSPCFPPQPLLSG